MSRRAPVAGYGATVRGLLLQDGLNWPGTGYWIGVTMHDPPPNIFTSKDGRRAKRIRCDLLGAADLSSVPLDLDDVG